MNFKLNKILIEWIFQFDWKAVVSCNQLWILSFQSDNLCVMAVIISLNGLISQQLRLGMITDEPLAPWP